MRPSPVRRRLAVGSSHVGQSGSDVPRRRQIHQRRLGYLRRRDDRAGVALLGPGDDRALVAAGDVVGLALVLDRAPGRVATEGVPGDDGVSEPRPLGVAVDDRGDATAPQIAVATTNGLPAELLLPVEELERA